MTLYLVRWEIDLNAESPQEAAQKALAIHRRPASLATVFDVFEGEGCNCTRVARIDLTHPEDSVAFEIEGGQFVEKPYAV